MSNMTFIPKYNTPCYLSKGIPGQIAELLDADLALQRRFREETISDLLVASILALPIDDLFILLPEEKRTGSDFDIIVVHEEQNQAVQFRIQAKRLSHNENRWRIGSYKELAHPHNTGAQASLLVRSSAHEKIPTIPLFAFYNPERVCKLSNGSVSGLELASGFAVNELIKEMVRAKPSRLPNKRLSTLQPLFFPFATLMCTPFVTAPASGVPRSVPSPIVFKRVVEQAIEATMKNVPNLFDLYGLKQISNFEALSSYEEPEVIESKPIRSRIGSFEEAPDSLSALPKKLRKIIERRDGEKVVRSRVRRPRIILTSSEA